jgi:autotransporter-associated beta strand protein
VTFGNGSTAYGLTVTGASANINVDQATAAGTNQTFTLGTLSTATASTINFTGAHGTSLIMGAVTNSSTSSPNATTIVNGITGGGTLTLGSLAYSSNTVAQAVNFQGGGNTIVAGAITQNGANAVSLTYSGSGSLTLQGSSNYTGGTTVSAGRVIVSGSLLGSAQVAAGAELDSGNNATAAIAGAVNLLGNAFTGAALAPGGTGDWVGATTIGDLTVGGNLTIGSAGVAAHLVIELGGTAAGSSYDEIQVAASSAIALTNANLDLSLANSFNPTTLTLASMSGGQVSQNGSMLFIVQGSSLPITTAFANAGAADPGLPNFGTYVVGNEEFAVSYQANATAGTFTGGHDIALMAIATVPEPSALSMLAGSLGLALGVQRFRRRGRSAPKTNLPA